MINHKIEVNEKVGITDFIPIIRGRTDMANIYIKEAQRYAKAARTAFDNTLTTPDDVNLLETERNNSQIAIIFSVFALEAHINKIGHDNLHPDIWDALERKRTEDKWFLFPKLITGNKFEVEEQLLKDFRNIIKLRDYLVHFKDYDYKELFPHPCGRNVIGIYELVNTINAELASNIAIKMITKLNEFLKENKK